MKNPETNTTHLNSPQILSKIGVPDWGGRDFTVIHSQIPPKFDIQYPFRSTDFIIGLVREGSLSMFINLKKVAFKRNSLFIITPYNILEFIEQSKNLKISGISFSRNFITGSYSGNALLESLGFLGPQNLYKLNVSEKRISELTKFFQIIEKLSKSKRNPHKKAMIRNMFEIFLYGVDIVLTPKYNIPKTKLSRKEELNTQFHNLLIQHFREQRSVNFYANELNVTSKYLSESIKEISGKTAGELIDEMIILEAKVLLKKNGVTVAQVADELHFSDQFLFSKFFKKHTSFSPSQYRNQ